MLQTAKARGRLKIKVNLIPKVSATQLLKRTLRDGAEMPPSAALRHEQAMIGLVLDSHDSHEGCNAFLAKRPAQFEGR